MFSIDSVLVIGIAAAGLPRELSRKAIFIGMAMAAGLQIIFAKSAGYLMSIEGILLIGGILLASLCWRVYKNLKEFNALPDEMTQIGHQSEDVTTKANFNRALVSILIADVSMSIDNILAVAAIARDNTHILIVGFALAIAMKAFFNFADNENYASL